LAIGESVVAIGVGASSLPVSTPLIVGSVLGVAISVCLWWLYFDIVSLAAEQSLLRRTGAERVQLAIEAYTYLHFLLIAGVVVTALGIEVALAHAHEEEGLGYFGALALNGGLALYLVGHLLFKVRMHNAWSVPRLLCAFVLLALTPVTAAVAPLAGMLLAVIALCLLVAVETRRYAEEREELRPSG
jgi:low temperature requirement protein LtrA